MTKILFPIGISQDEAREIHDRGFTKWITEITRLFNKFDKWEKGISASIFMENYRLIDARWEEYILDFIPLEHKNDIKPFLKTSLVEYESLARGSFPILYPEVLPVLIELKKMKFLHFLK